MGQTAGEPPYLRIVAELKRRIEEGELRPGDRVPSTRQVVVEWDVAMATATKALTTLRQQGWVRSKPGSGSVVGERPPARTWSVDEPTLSRERIVRTAIRVADREGRVGLSMRRVAAELEVGAMALYRYVPDKDELLRLMADAVFGAHPLPAPGARGWRADLELIARIQWRSYRQHPWLAPVLLASLNRPPVVASGMAHLNRQLQALHWLDARTRLHLVVTLNGYVGGIALSQALDAEQEQETGLSSIDRTELDSPLATELFESGHFPELREVGRASGHPDLEELFEFGLQRQLDGMAAFLTEREP